MILPNGKRKRISGTPTLNTKRAAEEMERAHIARLFAPNAPKLQLEVPTFERFADQFLAVATTKDKPSGVESKEMILRVHLRPTFKSRKLDQIGYGEVQDYVASKLRPNDPKAKPLAPKTINNHLTVLRRLLSVAKKRGLIVSVPEIEWLKVPKPEFDFLSFEEADRLVAAADDEWSTMMLVGLRTGLRHGELIALRWEDVDLVSGQLTVRRSAARGIVTTPKNGRTRDVPLGDEVLSALKRQRHLRGELVFCTMDGRMWRKNECKWPLWRACKRAGLRRIGWHVLRHSFASHLAMRGVPLKVVQELMGHATVEMTMRYAHLSPNVPREAVKLLDGCRGNDVATEQAG